MILVGICLGLASCKPAEPITVDSTVKIYGTVFDFASGEPLPRVQVELWRYAEHDDQEDQIVASTYSGSDGQYEFILDKVSNQYYGIEAYRAGYYGNDEYDLMLSPGNTYNVDIVLIPLH